MHPIILNVEKVMCAFSYCEVLNNEKHVCNGPVLVNSMFNAAVTCCFSSSVRKPIISIRIQL